MTPKSNPLRLNPLQLKTLAILQEVARQPGLAAALPGTDEIAIHGLPRAHGDHFHVGHALVHARDATGLGNSAVWTALQRKRLVGLTPDGARTLTALGQSYETGVSVVHRADH